MEKKKTDPTPVVEFDGYSSREGRGFSSVQTYYDDDEDLTPEHTIAITIEARSVDGESRDDPKLLERCAMAAADGVAGVFWKVGLVGEGEPVVAQVGRLANFIMARVPGEPSASEGAVDTAIRVLGRHYPEGGRFRTTVEALTAIAVRWGFELSHDSWPEKLEDFGRQLRTALGRKLEKRLSEPFAFAPAALESDLRAVMLPIASDLGWFEDDGTEAIDADELVRKVLRSVVLEST